jgi:branched-chain amino acid transport system substrate-binding protein
MRLRGLLFLVAALLAGCGRTGQGEQVFIGHLAPLQAADKTRFEHARQGMSLAIEELSQQHSTTPARQFVVLHVNAEEDLDQLQASAVRLLTVNRAIALIGGYDAAQVERLTRAAQPYEAPLITSAMTAPYLASDSLFSLEVSPARAAKAAARWLVETLHGDVLAFAFDSRSPVAAALATTLRTELQQGEKGRLIEVPFGPQPKFKEASETIGQAKAKAWLFFGKTEDWVGFRQALRESGAKIPCLVLDSVGPVEALPSAPVADGAVYQLTVYFPQEQGKASSTFQSNYARRFHADPDLYAAQGYDAVRLIAEASASAKTNLAGRPAVELSPFFKAPYSSCTGPLYLLQKNDKQPTLVLKIDPTAPN